MTGATTKFIYFDLGNVLLTFDHRRACVQLGELTGLDADRVWDVLFASGLQDRYEQGVVSSREVYEQFCGACFADPQAWPSFEAYHFANSDIFQLNVPVMALVGHLRSAGYPLGVLSNTCEAHWNHVAGGRYTMLQRAFETIVLSYEERSSKPDARIYEVAIERVAEKFVAVEKAGVEPGEIFFMDDRAENVAGACRAGLDAVLFESAQQLASDLRARGVHCNY